MVSKQQKYDGIWDGLLSNRHLLYNKLLFQKLFRNNKNYFKIDMLNLNELSTKN